MFQSRKLGSIFPTASAPRTREPMGVQGFKMNQSPEPDRRPHQRRVRLGLLYGRFPAATVRATPISRGRSALIIGQLVTGRGGVGRWHFHFQTR